MECVTKLGRIEKSPSREAVEESLDLLRSIIDLRWIQSNLPPRPLFLSTSSLAVQYCQEILYFSFCYLFLLTPRPWRAQPSLHLAPCHFFFVSTLPSLLNQPTNQPNPTQTNEPTSNWGLWQKSPKDRKETKGQGTFRQVPPANVMRSKQLILFSCLFCGYNASIEYTNIAIDWL